MLSQKQDVKNHREGTEAELGGIPENQLPLICRKTSVQGSSGKWRVALWSGLTVVVRLQEHLQDAKKSTTEVHQDATDAPAFSALSSVIHERLKIIQEHSFRGHKTGTSLPRPSSMRASDV